MALSIMPHIAYDKKNFDEEDFHYEKRIFSEAGFDRMLNMAKKMEAGQTQTLKKVLHYMKPYRFFLLFSLAAD